MKTKLTLLFLAFLFITNNDAVAQLPDGSIAPDFTATDIDGNEHSLYADFLDNGKFALLDISATWCGPCWTYHESHALKDLYNIYGENGSDEIGIFLIEGDNSTTLADLQGTGTSTLGDWITGTPYPIIDNSTIANLYEITYYPTIYGICPDGTLYLFGQIGASEIVSEFESKCDSFSLTGTSNNGAMEDNVQVVCSGENTSPSIEIQNFGLNNITSASLELFEIGNTTAIESINWSGNIAPYAKETVDFSFINDVTNPLSYLVKILTVNGNTDDFEYGNEAEISIEVAPSQIENTIKITIVTDNYPGETSWNFKNSEGEILKSFGPYQEGDGQAGAGGPDANQTFEYYVVIPLGTNCYELNLFDSYGDGLSVSAGSVQSGYSITSHNLTSASIISVLNKPNFGTEKTEYLGLESDGNGLSIDETSNLDFSIYPNPVYDFARLTIDGVMHNEEGQLSLVNVLGEIIDTKDIHLNKGRNEIPLKLDHLSDGLYTISIKSSSHNQSNTIVKIK